MPKITITREKNYLGMIRKFKVYLNEKQIGTVSNGGTSEFEIPEGNHQLYCKQDFLNVPIPIDFHVKNDDSKKFITSYEKTNLSMFLLIFGSMSSILFSRWITDRFKLNEYFYSLIYLGLFVLLLFSLKTMKAFKIKIIEQ